VGSFQITYNDFTGGHYMGNRDTEQPSNTWTGNNTVLDPRGNLVATDGVLLNERTGPTPALGDFFYLNGTFIHAGYISVIYTFLDSSAGTTTSYIDHYDIANNQWSGSPLTLTGVPVGYLAPDQTSSSPTLYYVRSSGDVRKLTFNTTLATWSDALATAGTNVTTSLYK